MHGLPNLNVALVVCFETVVLVIDQLKTQVFKHVNNLTKKIDLFIHWTLILKNKWQPFHF